MCSESRSTGSDGTQHDADSDMNDSPDDDDDAIEGDAVFVDTEEVAFAACKSQGKTKGNN